jgi:hypothetical protein
MNRFNYCKGDDFAKLPDYPALVADAETYLRAIRRPDIPVHYESHEAYEYSLGELPPHMNPPEVVPWTDSGGLLFDKWVCVAPGVGQVETLTGTAFVPWWYVYTYGTIGGTHEPEEFVTRPLCDARSPEEAIRLAILEVIKNELDMQALSKLEQQYVFEEVDVPQ